MWVNEFPIYPFIGLTTEFVPIRSHLLAPVVIVGEVDDLVIFTAVYDQFSVDTSYEDADGDAVADDRPPRDGAAASHAGTETRGSVDGPREQSSGPATATDRARCQAAPPLPSRQTRCETAREAPPSRCQVPHRHPGPDGPPSGCRGAAAGRGSFSTSNHHSGRIRRSRRPNSCSGTALGLGRPLVPVDWRLVVVSSQGPILLVSHRANLVSLPRS